VERAAIAGLSIKVSHAAHACGYKLANDGHDTRAIQAYRGHRNIQNTRRYAALAPQRLNFLEIDEGCPPVFLPIGSAEGFAVVLYFAQADRRP
jgi:integrase-like protein